MPADPPDVYVVVDAGGGDGFEELPAPPRRTSWPWLHRYRRALLAAGVAVAVGAVVVALLGDTPRRTSAAASDPTPTPTLTLTPTRSPTFGSSVAIEFPRPDVLPGTLARGTFTITIDGLPTSFVVNPASPPLVTVAPRSCGTRPIACTTVPTISDPARAALQAAFPGLRLLTVSTVVADDGVHAPTLWFRQVDGRIGRLDVIVRVEQPRRADRLSGATAVDGVRGFVYLETRTAGLTIQIQVDGPSGLLPHLKVLQHLAADQRLLRLA